jgi:hypothetical protein
VLYVAFWCLAVYLVWDRARPLAIAVCVLVLTCALEVLQLWHPPLLKAARATFLGRTLLGTTFVWLDFPHYALGCLLGWTWIRWLQRLARETGDG